MKPKWILGFSAALLTLGSIPAFSQPVVSAKAGLITVADGNVMLGDQAVELTATKFPEMKENSVLRTEEGRAEVLLTPGVTLHLGENSSFRMITTRLIDTRLELLTGSAVVDAFEIAKDTNVTVVCKNATVLVAKGGHYRFDAEPARIRVFEGLANVDLAGQRVDVSSGKMLSLGGDLASAEKFDKTDTDSLDNWARRRDEVMALANVSAAKSAGSGGYGGYGNGYGYASAMGSGAGMWGWNSYYGMYTYIPYSGRFCDQLYGYCYYSPNEVARLYYNPPVPVFNTGNGGFGASNPYPASVATSGGYSGTIAASSSVSVAASPAAAASVGSSAASSAGASSVGHGSASGGGHGH